jgi:hypothetical protein
VLLGSYALDAVGRAFDNTGVDLGFFPMLTTPHLNLEEVKNPEQDYKRLINPLFAATKALANSYQFESTDHEGLERNFMVEKFSSLALAKKNKIGIFNETLAYRPVSPLQNMQLS